MIRLNKIEEISNRASKLGTQVLKPSPSILALAAEGYKRKDTKAKLERSVSFGMMSAEDDDPRPTFAMEGLKENSGH